MSDSSPDTMTANIDLTIGQRRLQARIEVPAGPTRLIQLLPIIRTLTDVAVAEANETAAAAGHPVSCRAGCAACCRHLVPVSAVEARRLRELIEDMPEPRRSQVLARFADAQRRLAEAGLLDGLLADTNSSDEDASRRKADYLRLKVPCPFLEDESCSIYEERPIVCREYVVVSPPDQCGDPDSKQVRVVRLPLDAWAAFKKLTPSDSLVPLVLAPQWVDAHPEPPPDRTGPEILSELFSHLTGGTVPPPPVPEP